MASSQDGIVDEECIRAKLGMAACCTSGSRSPQIGAALREVPSNAWVACRTESHCSSVVKWRLQGAASADAERLKVAARHVPGLL